VPAESYDESYYRTCCAGYEEWTASQGARADPLYDGSLQFARLRPGEVVVDVGTGRGELLAVAVERGAARAIGVEYAPDAVRLAEQTLAAHRLGADRAEVIRGDARRLPLGSSSADLVMMLDVVEHLTPPELDAALREALRVLRPGGRVFCHTLPNRLIYDITYRLQRLARPRRVQVWPVDPRNRLEHAFHVNEQTRRGLARALRRAGFAPVWARHGHWIHSAMVPEERARELYPRLAAHRATRCLGVADIWAGGLRPSASPSRSCRGS